MNSKFNTINLNLFNCRGLRNKTKRRQVFAWVQNSHYGITFLQETHSIVDDESTWKIEWGNDIIFSHGNSTSRGVAILVPKT